MNRLPAFLLLACFAVFFAQTLRIESQDAGGVPKGKTQSSHHSAAKADLSTFFHNSRLKVDEGRLRAVDGDDRFRIASGIWLPEEQGNDLVSPEQVSISCSATDKSCSVLRIQLIVTPRNIGLDGPDETDFAIVSWDKQGLLASNGPDAVDKCHRSVLSMSFASGQVSLSDIPTHEKGCEMFLNTNTYRLHPGSYYVDTTPNNEGVKF